MFVWTTAVTIQFILCILCANERNFQYLDAVLIVLSVSGLRCWCEALLGQMAASSADLVITELSLADELAQCCTDDTKGTDGMTEGDNNVVKFSVLLSITLDLVCKSPDNMEDGNMVVSPPRTSSDWWLEEDLVVETVDDAVITDAVDNVTGVETQQDEKGDANTFLELLDE